MPPPPPYTVVFAPPRPMPAHRHRLALRQRHESAQDSAACLRRPVRPRDPSVADVRRTCAFARSARNYATASNQVTIAKVSPRDGLQNAKGVIPLSVQAKLISHLGCKSLHRQSSMGRCNAIKKQSIKTNTQIDIPCKYSARQLPALLAGLADAEIAGVAVWVALEDVAGGAGGVEGRVAAEYARDAVAGAFGGGAGALRCDVM
ncbi:hypothetical protein R3P38DRAFT_308149 [Favolaschia claudopus]|uniref:Uncharacterized protein n=1 Tax=Favolaschia claudopus TaxID=2862362 RepID=A0AAW0CTW6_9AGAR